MDTYLEHIVNLLPTTWKPGMLYITMVGSPVTVSCAVVVGLSIVFFYKRYTDAFSIALCVLSVPLYMAIKVLAHRARPLNEMVQTLGIHDYSFPSGHATASLVVYGTLCWVLTKGFSFRIRFICFCICAVLIFLIGISRVYLGVHYPTDVLGGWLLGSIYLYVLYIFSSRFLKTQ